MHNYFVSYRFKEDFYSEIIGIDFDIKNTDDFYKLKSILVGKNFTDSITIINFRLL